MLYSLYKADARTPTQCFPTEAASQGRKWFHPTGVSQRGSRSDWSSPVLYTLLVHGLFCRLIRYSVLYTPLVHRIKWTNYNLDWSYLARQKVTGNSRRVYKWNQFLTFKKFKYWFSISEIRSPIGTLECVIGGPCSSWWSPGIVVTALCIVAFIVVARVLNIINVSLVPSCERRGHSCQCVPGMAVKLYLRTFQAQEAGNVFAR